MPRFFFNVVDGYDQRDLDGTELPDLDTARAEAIRLSGEILKEMGIEFWHHTDWNLIVEGEGREALFTLRFSAEEHLPARKDDQPASD